MLQMIDARATQRRPTDFAPATVRGFQQTRIALEAIALGYSQSKSRVLWSGDRLSFRTTCGDIITAIQCPEPRYPQPEPENARFIIEVEDASGEFMGFL